jgi:hypothetical protein
LAGLAVLLAAGWGLGLLVPAIGAGGDIPVMPLVGGIGFLLILVVLLETCVLMLRLRRCLSGILRDAEDRAAEGR